MKVSIIVREAGHGEFFKRASGYLYRHSIRRFLPISDSVRYAGVPISRDRKLGDSFLPSFFRPFDIRDLPDYEATLVQGLRTHLRKGDKVVIVGGGEGVTVTIAALLVGPLGSVTCFEGGHSYAENVLTTAKRNGVLETISVHHAIVGRSINVHGPEEFKSSKIILPEDLPECDVLELDCEGAETVILSDMKIRPRAIIVETHGLFGSPTIVVRDILDSKGYAVSDLGWAEPGRIQECKEHDVRILAATLRTIDCVV